MTTRAWPDDGVARDLRALRERRPLVHCLTNDVAAPLTANALLAVGAAPAMVPARREVTEFLDVADALLVNVGTIREADEEAMHAAASHAHRTRTPWVLDPVAVGSLPLRTAVARDLLESRPTVVRGNASEILGLAGSSRGGRGVDATATPADAVDAATALAGRTRGVIAISGQVDLVVDADGVVEIPGGDPRMTHVSGLGCALGAIVAAMLAVAPSPADAAVAASASVATAGARAAAGATGPGSLAVALLDELAALDPDEPA